jgi:addiction module RelB/DinJ family antitoxin
MNNASILIKTDPQVKKEAQQTVKELGLSLSSVVTRLLKEFVKTKTITYTTEERLTPYAKAQLAKARENRKQGKSSPIFDNAKDAIEWLHK